jgi:hypothetical protein
MKKPISKLLLLLVVSLLSVSAQGQPLEMTVTHSHGPGCGTKAERQVKKASQHTEAIGVAVEEALAAADVSLPELPGLPLGQGPRQPDRPEAGEQPQPAFAHEKVKSLSRTFKVGANDKLNIENQFGRVEVQTWAKNEIAVEVTIIARAETESKAQEIMDHINIKISEGGDLISFVTEREPMTIRSNTQKSFEINYVVRMPKRNALRVGNKHGTIQLPDMDGPTEVDLRYGKLTAGSLNNVRNRINVAYSGAECQIAFVKGGDLDFKYSSLRLNAADAINTNTGYSSITINKVDALVMESRYDTRFLIGSAGQIAGTGSYSAIKIGSLRESANLNVRYCSGFEISNVAASFKKLELTGGYTGMALGFADNSAFNFEVDTQYGSLKMNQDLADFTFREVKNTSSSYKGKYGKATPKAVVNVTSRYGSVRFN